MMDNFKLWKKWFWIGIIVGSLNSIAGFVYSIAMIVEPEHRKEGLIILGWTVLSFILLLLIVGPTLQ